MMAWGMPPPPPPRPASLGNLTMAELQRMEGNERRAIEARLQVTFDLCSNKYRIVDTTSDH